MYTLIIRNALRLALGGVVAVFPSVAWSTAFTATVAYQPFMGSTPIPALGGAGLIALAILLLVMAWRFQRRGMFTNNPLLGVCLAVAIAAAGASGTKLVYAQANNGGIVYWSSLGQEAGGSVTVSGPATACVVNVTGATQQITGITPLTGYLLDPEGASKTGFCPEYGIAREGEVEASTGDIANVGEAPVCVASSTVLAPNRVCSVTTVNEVPF